MKSIWLWLFIALSLQPRLVLGESPFNLLGLHSDLAFNRTMERVADLGATCAIERQTGRSKDVTAHCNVPRCDESEADACPVGSAELAGQPVILIGFQAPDTEAQVTQLILSIAGSPEVIAAYLENQFGKPYLDTRVEASSSWTRSSRIAWKSGQYQMRLRTHPLLITLASEPDVD